MNSGIIVGQYSGLIASFVTLSMLCNFAIGQSDNRDSSFVLPFERRNVVEVFSGAYGAGFYFSDRNRRSNEYRFQANSSVYIGADINYKWLFLEASFNVPGTSLDRNVHFKYTLIKFRFGGANFFFEPFYNQYSGLLKPGERPDSFEVLPGMIFSHAGMRFYYYGNRKKFSAKAANRFSELQRKSAGAVFFSATPQWQKISWLSPSKDIIKDSVTYSILSGNPQWLSMVLKAGYTYNFVFHHGKWLVAPAIMAGAGFLKELTTDQKKIQQIKSLQGWLNMGYNGPVYYCFFNVSLDWSNTRLLQKDMHRLSTDFSFTAGYRFRNAQQKFFGFL